VAEAIGDTQERQKSTKMSVAYDEDEAFPLRPPSWSEVEEENAFVQALYDDASLSETDRNGIADILQIADLNLRYGALLFLVCSSTKSFPFATLRVLLTKRPEAAQYRDPDTGRTALHEVTSNNFSIQPNIVRLLVETYPPIAHIRDEEDYSLPIDLLAGVALMREERLKYLSKHVDSRDTTLRQVETDLDRIWECARYLVLDPELFDRHIPILHALLPSAAGDVPMSLLEQAIRHHSLSQADDEGNLPLHLIADLRRQQTQTDDDEEDAGESTMYLLTTILQKHPAAAGVRNHNDRLPIDLAIESGRRWDTGIALLLDAHPLSGMDRRFRTFAHFPLIFDELLNHRHRSGTVYAFLQANPKVLISSKSKSS